MRLNNAALKVLSAMAAMMMVVLACSIPGTPAPAPAVTEPPATQALSATQTPVPVLPASPPDLPVLTNPSLTALDMLDSLNGWGTTETSLVCTLDGGLTWYDITPPGAGSLGYPASVFFLDPATGWVVMAGSDFMTGTLAYTIDGGFSWTLVAVPFAGGQIDFLNATTGFILVGRGAAAGSSAVDVYSSADGGATWTPVYIMQPGAGEDVNTLPFSGQKSGITFLDSQHGWVGGNIPMDGYVYFYASSDGGHVWNKQDVSLPTDYESAMTEVRSAQFFNGMDGVFCRFAFWLETLPWIFMLPMTVGSPGLRQPR